MTDRNTDLTNSSLFFHPRHVHRYKAGAYTMYKDAWWKAATQAQKGGITYYNYWPGAGLNPDDPDTGDWIDITGSGTSGTSGPTAADVDALLAALNLDWLTVNSTTTSLDAGKYTINSVTGTQTISAHTLDDNQSFIIRDTKGLLSEDDFLLLDLGGSFTLTIGDVTTTGTMPFELDVKGVDAEFIRRGSNWEIDLDTGGSHADQELQDQRLAALEALNSLITDHVQHNLTASDFTPALTHTETPAKAAFDAWLVANPTAKAGQVLRYTSPFDQVYELPIRQNATGDLFVNPLPKIPLVYTDSTVLADTSVFAPGTLITIIEDGLRTPYAINAAGGLVDSDFEGAGGGNTPSEDPNTKMYTPEMFGAIGDGVTNDYAALLTMAIMINTENSSKAERKVYVKYRAGATYFIDEIKENSDRVRVNPDGRNGVNDIVFESIEDLTIDFAGSKIKHNTVDRLDDTEDTPYIEEGCVVPFFFSRCNTVLNGPGEIHGSTDTSQLKPGTLGTPSHGIVQWGGSLVVNNIDSSYWHGDGLWVGGYWPIGAPNKITAEKTTIIGGKFNFNGRQGISIVGCADCKGYDVECRENGNSPYGNHTPAAGIDVEPLSNQTKKTNAIFYRPRLINNGGGPFVASADLDNTAIGGGVGEVKIFDVYASTLPGKDATASARRFRSRLDLLEIEGGTIKDLTVFADEGLMRLNNVVIEQNLEDQALLGSSGSIEFTNGQIISKTPNPVTGLLIDIDDGLFENNSIYLFGQTRSQTMARFQGTTVGENVWKSDIPSNTNVIYTGIIPAPQTYIGQISQVEN